MRSLPSDVLERYARRRANNMKLLALTIIAVLFMGSILTLAQDPSDIKVAYGKTERFDGGKLRVKFLDVIEDSRCPEGVNCIWAGNARIKIALSDGDNSCEYEIETNGSKQLIEYGGFVIELKSLEPNRKENDAIAIGDYIATFSIKPKSKG